MTIYNPEYDHIHDKEFLCKHECTLMPLLSRDVRIFELATTFFCGGYSSPLFCSHCHIMLQIDTGSDNFASELGSHLEFKIGASVICTVTD